MQSWDLTGKTALVSGASQGIGEAAAQLLAERGARIIALARNEEKLKSLVKNLPGAGHGYYVVDLSDLETLQKVILPAVQKEKVEILINNAGGPKGGLLYQADFAEFEAPIKAHLLASHLLVQAVIPAMKAAGYGRIVNIISTSVKNPLPGLGVSNTVRGAMASWSKTLAGELGAFAITVNNILPGYIKTGRLESLMGSAAEKAKGSVEDVENQWKDSVPLKRIGEPREVAEAIAFLVSPAASY
ncbi:MAG: SDR family oxidoreductase, partial [Bdellovibrio sp.]